MCTIIDGCVSCRDRSSLPKRSSLSQSTCVEAIILPSNLSSLCLRQANSFCYFLFSFFFWSCKEISGFFFEVFFWVFHRIFEWLAVFTASFKFLRIANLFCCSMFSLLFFNTFSNCSFKCLLFSTTYVCSIFNTYISLIFAGILRHIFCVSFLITYWLCFYLVAINLIGILFLYILFAIVDIFEKSKTVLYKLLLLVQRFLLSVSPGMFVNVFI